MQCFLNHSPRVLSARVVFVHLVLYHISGNRHNGISTEPLVVRIFYSLFAVCTDLFVQEKSFSFWQDVPSFQKTLPDEPASHMCHSPSFPRHILSPQEVECLLEQDRHWIPCYPSGRFFASASFLEYATNLREESCFPFLGQVNGIAIHLNGAWTRHRHVNINTCR